MNADLAAHVLDELRRAGVAELIVCPGGRNAPWIALLAAADCPFRVTWHFEERSAAFFALGRSRATGRPIAVCTTSGTAAGELLPAAMEAFYSGAPLILLTADRPRRFRGSGAPQAAEQRELYGPYVLGSFDLEGDERLDLSGFEIRAPLHINVCFEEPGGEPAGPATAGDQRAAADPVAALRQFLATARRPLVILGGLRPKERLAVERFVLGLGAPVYAEAPSGLRESSALEGLRIRVGDRLLGRAERVGHAFDGVLRIGSVPTHRLWRDLEERAKELPVLSVSRLPFSGLGRPSDLAVAELPELLASAPSSGPSSNGTLLAEDRALYDGLTSLLRDESASEPGMVHALSLRIEPGASIFLGNSMPVREWDLAATFDARRFEVGASRGQNGIDGEVSAFLGQCRPDTSNWAVLGDLTTLYDLAGPWVGRSLDPAIRATIVVLNNGGGRIFGRMFPETEFQNLHGVSFEAWADLWNLGYQLCHSIDSLSSYGAALRVVELRPDSEATARFWTRYEELLQ